MRGWLHCPSGYNGAGGLLVDWEEIAPTYRPGAQQSDKVRAVDDLNGRSTNEAAAVHAPINLPSWNHLASITKKLRERGLSAKLGLAKTDHTGPDKQLPKRWGRGLSAVVTFRSPADGEF